MWLVINGGYVATRSILRDSTYASNLEDARHDSNAMIKSSLNLISHVSIVGATDHYH